MKNDLYIEEVSKKRSKSFLKNFQNQHKSLQDYPYRFSLRHREKDQVGNTYLAILREKGGEERLAGYFSLTTASIGFESTVEVETLKKLPKFPIPGILVTRLAVDSRCQGQGLGRYLVEEIFEKILSFEEAGLVFRVVLVDAIDENASTFYKKFGFKQLSETFPAKMVLDWKQTKETFGK